MSSSSAGGAPEQGLVILGAGVSGLYAARTVAREGVPVTVLERAEVVGGLAAGRTRNGNHYDFGVHHLHAQDAEIFADLQELLGERLLPVAKDARIRHGRGFRRYPLRFWDILLGIPPWELAGAVAGLAFQSLRNRFHRQPPANAEEALVRLYGRPLYEQFFRDFTRRYWGMPATELSATFVSTKMPRLGAVDGLKRLFGRFGAREGAAAVESALAEEILYYTPTGCREFSLALARAVAAAGGRILLDMPVTAVEHDGRRVQAVRGQPTGGGEERRLPCAALLSTIPLPALVAAMEPAAPVEVQEAARNLRFQGTAVYAFLLRRERSLDCLYTYFREHIFHRVAEPARSGLVVAPPGHTVLVVELSCRPGDARWRGDAAVREQVVAELAAEGLLRPEEVVECHVFANEHAYPVFALGFEERLATVRRWLAGLENLCSTGRNGAFCYPNMHGAMRMGLETARELLPLLQR